MSELGGRRVEIVVKSTIPLELVKDNIEASFSRDVERFHKLPDLGKGTGPVAIIGGGPSLKNEIDNLKVFPGPLVGCGSVHDYLIDQGVPPIYHVIVDPCPEMANWIKKPSKGITYLLASQCHADVFNALKDFPVRMFHAFLEREDGTKVIDFRGEPTIPGGSFVIGRAWPISAVLGHRDMHFYGFDCSFPIECKDQHAYPYEWDREEPCWVTVEHTGEKFATTPGWMAQLDTFMKLLALTAGQFEITIHGDSLASSMCCKPRVA